MVLDVAFTRDAKGLFRNNGNKHAIGRLSSLGITGSWQCASTCPDWAAELRDQVCLAIMKQRGIPIRQEAGLDQGPWLIRPQPLQRKGAPAWRMRNTPDVAQVPVLTRSRAANTASQGYQVACQKCRSTLLLADKPVTTGNGQRLLRCHSCKTRSRIAGMTCIVCNQRVSRCDCSISTHAKRQSRLSCFWQRCVSSSGGGDNSNGAAPAGKRQTGDPSDQAPKRAKQASYNACKRVRDALDSVPDLGAKRVRRNAAGSVVAVPCGSRISSSFRLNFE